MKAAEIKTLLVVDDEADLREILVFSLERYGYKVLTACNGREAFQIVQTNRIDLIISDIQMPGGNGVELLDNVRNYHHELPVLLFLTGFADITLEQAYDKGAEALFAKPFDIKQILSTIERALSPKEDRWQRRSDRHETEINIELKFPGFDEARKAKVLNIGRGGIFVSLDKDFPKVTDSVSFKIEFSEGLISMIEGTGVVKWARIQATDALSAGCGIEFVELSNGTRLKVIEVINFLKTKQYIPRV